MNRGAGILLVSATCAGVVLALATCKKDEPPPVVTKSPFKPPAAVEQRAKDPLPKLRYTDMTQESGIDFVHDTGADGRKLLPETMGSGVAVLDWNGDSRPDLLFLSGKPWKGATPSTNGAPTLRLYENVSHWKFREVTQAAGLADVRPYALGAACADVDGDGDTDVLVTGLDGYWLLRNDGGKFTSLDRKLTGLDPGTWKDAQGEEHGPFATSAAFLDYDLDGRPDLFVCHYVHWSEKTDVYATMDGKTKSYATPAQYRGESCRLWKNLGPDAAGNPRFEDATDKAGVRNDEGKSLGVVVTELNGDNRPDVIVANDTQPNYVYMSKADGTFHECGRETGIALGTRDARARAGMGIDTCTAGPQDRLTVVIGNFSAEPAGFWEWNEKTKVFKDRSDVSRVAEATLPWLTFGVRVADVDLDGRTDLLLANGHIEPTVQDVHSDIPYRQPLQVLRHLSDDTYLDITKFLGAPAFEPRVHRGLAVADLDADGDLDLIATVNGGPPVLLRSDLDDVEKRTLRIRLIGDKPGTDALGARVTVTTKDEAVQTQWVRSGGSYLSEGERTLTFGLGDNAGAATVLIRWPDGRERTLRDVAPGLQRIQR